MKLLHLAAGNLYGGVERIVAECAASRHLAPALQPAFAVCFDGRLAREIDATGQPCAILGDVRVSLPQTVLRARKRLSLLLAAALPDAAICHSSWTFGLAAPVLQRHGVPAVLWIHDRVSGRPWAERWAARTSPALVICNSRFTAESARTLFREARTSVVYAPVRPPAGGAQQTRGVLRSAFGARDGEAVVLIASRFEAWKGHRALIAALAAIEPRWRLWIAGGPQKPGEQAYVAALQEQCRAAGVADRVTFLGHREDVPALMQAADVLCQPNTAPEPFGLAFVEALYAGLPVVTTAMGGALEIVTPDCGVLVPPADGAALPEALGGLLHDAARRRRLGAAGPHRAMTLCDPARQLAELGRLLRCLDAAPCH